MVKALGVKARTGAAGALALALLAACGAPNDRDPFVDSRPPPGLAERFYPPEGWAWGLVGVKDGPLQRYGVAAPPVVARGNVLILPDYGETAETWFETARDLNESGYTVWVLEGVGQGGSQRLASPRDLGDVTSFDADALTVRAMIDQVIRASPDAPVIVLGQGVGALIAARALEVGARPAGVILSAPPCQSTYFEGGDLRRFGLGRLRGPGSAAWKRDGQDAFAGGLTHDPWRGAVTHAWQTANPDLRMGGPSLDWLAAFSDLQRQTAGDLPRLAAPTLIMTRGGADACVAVPGAERQAIAGADRALELEDDARRGPWLGAVTAFLGRLTKATADRRAADHAP
ncbi:MAG: alpha/beta fold hydrolase [Caulobacterales bacterium]